MIDPNAPAYPCIPTNRSGQCAPMEYGLTIRAEIAARIYAHVLGGYATGVEIEACNYNALAAESVKAADALIAELSKEPT